MPALEIFVSQSPTIALSWTPLRDSSPLVIEMVAPENNGRLIYVTPKLYIVVLHSQFYKIQKPFT